MALFGIFGGKGKKYTETNNTNKKQILSILTQLQMTCKNPEAQGIVRNITTQLQAQGETAAEEVLAIDSAILTLLSEANTYIIKQQFPTAIMKLNTALEETINRSEYCMLGGTRTKEEQKRLDEAKAILEKHKKAAAPKTRSEELQAKLDELNAQLDAEHREWNRLAELHKQNPKNVSVNAQATATKTKITMIQNEINATQVELTRELQEATIETVARINEDLAAKRTHTDAEMEIKRAQLADQNAQRQQDMAQNAADAELLGMGTAGMDADPFADPFGEADAFADPFGEAETAGAQTQFGGFDAGALGTAAMATNIRKTRMELENSMGLYNDKIDDANADLQDLNTELRPLLEKRKNASPSDCLSIDSVIDQINARRNAVITRIKRYRQAAAALSDKLALLDKLDIEQDIASTNSKIAQLTGGKFSDFQGLALFLNDAIKKSNEEREEIDMAVTVAESEQILSGSASAAAAAIADAGDLSKDEAKYNALMQEIGMPIA